MDTAIGAVCASPDIDPELFFPAKGDSVGAAKAKALCFSCPRRISCLEESLDAEIEYGVWGGVTGKERLALVARRKRAAVLARRTEVVTLIRSGLTRAEVSRRTGIPYTTVVSWAV